jgi:hypothetical protein
MTSRQERKQLGLRSASAMQEAHERIKRAVGESAYQKLLIYCRVVRCDVADLYIEEAVRLSHAFYHSASNATHPRTAGAMGDRAELIDQLDSTISRAEYEDGVATPAERERIVRHLTSVIRRNERALRLLAKHEER